MSAGELAQSYVIVRVAVLRRSVVLILVRASSRKQFHVRRGRATRAPMPPKDNFADGSSRHVYVIRRNVAEASLSDHRLRADFSSGLQTTTAFDPFDAVNASSWNLQTEDPAAPPRRRGDSRVPRVRRCRQALRGVAVGQPCQVTRQARPVALAVPAACGMEGANNASLLS